METELQRAIRFLSAPGFARLVEAMGRRYRRVGRFGGQITLTEVNDEEREALSSLLHRELRGRDKITISVGDLQAALDTAFSGELSLIELIAGITGKELLPIAVEHRDMVAKRQQVAECKAQFFAGLRREYSVAICQAWLNYIEQTPVAARGIHRAYERDAVGLRAELQDVLRALTMLPEDSRAVVRLSAWAMRVTGDAHAFDQSSNRASYLMQALSFHRRSTAGVCLSPFLDDEEQAELLESFGIVIDDIGSFVSSIGLLAFGQAGALPSWQGAVQEGAVTNLPVRELAKVRQVRPATDCQEVFVVASANVFSDLLDQLPDCLVPLICTHGKLGLATLLLLDRLVEAGVTVWYSGNHDPEGIMLAERLARRYPSHFQPWRFGRADYLAALSDAVVVTRRIRQLSEAKTPGLQELVCELTKMQRAAYQEQLTPLLLSDLRQRFC